MKYDLEGHPLSVSPDSVGMTRMTGSFCFVYQISRESRSFSTRSFSAALKMPFYFLAE